MERLPSEEHRRLKRVFTAMDKERQMWFSHWQQISDYYLPRRYPYLTGAKERRSRSLQNRKLLTSVSTMAVRTLASGLMNGITSPARPWFSLRVSGFEEDTLTRDVKVYLEEVARRILLILAESNFYNALAILYLEWCTFGTASMMISEDYTDVIRCNNFALGEFYISQDENGRVNRFGRRFTMTLENAVNKFGLENLRPELQAQFKQGGQKLFTEIEIVHLIQPTSDERIPFTEYYWDIRADDGQLLAKNPYFSWPIISPRWELLSGESYGVSPAMDALADVIELQHTLYERKIGLEKSMSPPLLVDAFLQNRPKALAAKGLTFVPNLGSMVGAKQAYTVNPPMQEVAYDVQQLTARIEETCYNPLFNMISQLDTVRSSNEIDALREEKLVGLGPVLERFHHEGLTQILRRVYDIADRAGLLPERPEALDGLDLQIQYISVLSDAQRAVGTASIERFFGLIGNLAAVYPEVTKVPDVEELLRDYAEGIGVKATGIRSRQDLEEEKANEAQLAQLQQAAELGQTLATGAKTLSETEVGAGKNALQEVLG